MEEEGKRDREWREQGTREEDRGVGERQVGDKKDEVGERVNMDERKERKRREKGEIYGKGREFKRRTIRGRGK